MGIDADQTYVTGLFNPDVVVSVGYLIKGYAVKNDLVQQKYNAQVALTLMIAESKTEVNNSSLLIFQYSTPTIEKHFLYL